MGRQRIRSGLLALALAGPIAVGCESSPATPALPVAPPVEPAPPPLDVFSAERAWSDLLALSVAPSPGQSDPARAHLVSTLGGLGLQVREIETPGPEIETPDPEIETPGPEIETPDPEEDASEPLLHLSATLPGASSDLFMLVAPYAGDGSHESPPLGGNAGVSGAALLIELARVLSTRRLPYTIQFVFLAGEESGALGPPRWWGSRGLAEQLDEGGELVRTRLLVVFDQVCGTDLRIARDLGSHRMYREEFFKAARRIGRERAFPPGQAFEQVQASHRAFLDRGLRASVAIVGVGVGRERAPEENGAAEDTPDAWAGCVPESLEAVGLVSLEALDTIGRRLAKIDRFSRLPLAELEPEQAPDPVLLEVDPALSPDPSVDPEAASPTEPDAPPPEPIDVSGEGRPNPLPYIASNP